MSIDPSILEDLSPRGTAVKWEKVGDVRKVIIESAKKQPDTDFQTGLPTYFKKSGEPRFNLVITGTDPDTGEKATMYLKFWGSARRALEIALEGRPLEVGATLAVKWEGEEPVPNTKYTARTWKMRYEPPAPVALEANDLF